MADETRYKTELDSSSSPPSAKAIDSVPTSSEKKRPREIQGSDSSEVFILTCKCGKSKQHVPCTNAAKEIFPPIWTCEECLILLSNNDDSFEQTVVSPTRSDASVNQPSKSASSSVPIATDISPAKKQKKQQDDAE